MTREENGIKIKSYPLAVNRETEKKKRWKERVHGLLFTQNQKSKELQAFKYVHTLLPISSIADNEFDELPLKGLTRFCHCCSSTLVCERYLFWGEEVGRGDELFSMRLVEERNVKESSPAEIRGNQSIEETKYLSIIRLHLVWIAFPKQWL